MIAVLLKKSKKQLLCYSSAAMKRKLKTEIQKQAGYLIRGILSVNSRAVGFIEDEQHKEDIMIEMSNLATALNRDEVEVELLKGRVRGRRTGKVVRIIKRAKTQFVGTIEERGTRLVLIPDDFRMYAAIRLPQTSADFTRTDAEKIGTGIKALVQITEWKVGKEPQGEILKVLGKKGEHEVEMESIVLERGFGTAFPPEVEREAHEIAKMAPPFPDSEIRKRRDFRKTLLFTIDPANAKDFDDALSLREITNHKFSRFARSGKARQITNKKLYEIGIHIADVSHYVREGTALDREARERGTSVYLVDRTIPMLPHALSNDLCSLNPNVDRLAFSAVFEMDDNGRVYSRWFGKTVIHSQKRFTYESAQELIDSTRSDLVESPESLTKSAYSVTRSDLVETLQKLNSIAKKLRAEKERKGAIDFEQDEVGFELDNTGRPIRVFKKKRLDTHKLIEEFMLLANREVAHFFYQVWKKSGGKLAFIYRTHDLPDREKLEQLRVFVRALGHEFPLGKDGNVTGKDLQALFNAIEGHASESLIKTAAIRSMAKAVYSTANIGHFGLAFEYYTHFTSPIRRYPDLLVHRSLFSILENHKLDPAKLAGLERMASDATQKEIAAAEAERESIKLKQVEFMQDRLGKEFDGIISGVTEWGIYVEEKETRSEGMVKLRDLGDDYYVLDEKNYRVVGERTKKKYSLGDRVRFKIVGADVERKTLDYKIV